jgi:hypothetical protein|tara:strand:- start:272 stop:493 length:222 start_codon:yes stop_codon:yes gene_type:complete
MPETTTHALRFVANGLQTGGICACGWHSKWRRTEWEVEALEYDWHVAVAEGRPTNRWEVWSPPEMDDDDEVTA